VNKPACRPVRPRGFLGQSAQRPAPSARSRPRCRLRPVARLLPASC
jgi:hypothetical protein